MVSFTLQINLGKMLLFALAEWGGFQVQTTFNLTQKREKESCQVKSEKILTWLILPKQVHPMALVI